MDSARLAEPIDVAQIKGNIPDDEKLLALNIFKFFVCPPGTRIDSDPASDPPTDLYGVHIGKRLKCIEMNVLGRTTRAPIGQTIFELVVERGEGSLRMICMPQH